MVTVILSVFCVSWCPLTAFPKVPHRVTAALPGCHRVGRVAGWGWQPMWKLGEWETQEEHSSEVLEFWKLYWGTWKTFWAPGKKSPLEKSLSKRCKDVFVFTCKNSRTSYFSHFYLSESALKVITLPCSNFRIPGLQFPIHPAKWHYFSSHFHQNSFSCAWTQSCCSQCRCRGSDNKLQAMVASRASLRALDLLFIPKPLLFILIEFLIQVPASG